MRELEAVEKARAGRDAAEGEFVAAVLAAHEAGASYRVIARHAGLSHQRIAQVVTAAREVATPEG